MPPATDNVRLVLGISRGRGFPRSRSVGFVVRCQLVGQERVSRTASGESPFWGDVFSWDVSGALLKKLFDSAPAVKLQVYHLAPTGNRTEVALGHVLLHLKTVGATPAPRCVRARLHR